MISGWYCGRATKSLQGFHISLIDMMSAGNSLTVSFNWFRCIVRLRIFSDIIEIFEFLILVFMSLLLYQIVSDFFGSIRDRRE